MSYHSKYANIDISLWNGTTDTDSKLVKPLKYVLDVIKEVQTELHKKVLAATTKKERQSLKSRMPAATFTGVFQRREAAALKTYSALMVLDIDNLDADLFQQVRYESAPSLPYAISVFTSPSGNGVKIIVATDATPETHKKVFAALSADTSTALGVDIDKSGSNLDRLCFIPYDPQIYVNWNASVYAGTVHDLISRPAKPARLTSAEMALKIAEAIYQTGQDITADYSDWQEIAFACAVHGEDGRQIFHLLSSMNAEYDGDATDKKFDDALRSGRFTSDALLGAMAKRLNIDLKSLFAGHSTSWTTTPPKKKPSKPADEPEQSKEDSSKTKKSDGPFWKWKRETNAEGKTSMILQVSRPQFLEFLKDEGFCLVQEGESCTYNIVREENCVLKNSNVVKMKHHVMAYLKKEKAYEVAAEVGQKHQAFFQPGWLDFLDIVKAENNLQHQKNKVHLIYENCVVDITPESIQVRPLAELEGKIWERQRIGRPFHQPSDPADVFKAEFFRFVVMIACGKDPYPGTPPKPQPEGWEPAQAEAEEMTETDWQKVDSIQTSLGYLLHNYKDESVTKAIVAVDKTIAQSPDDANGRTGKSLLGKALQQIASMITIDGKNFKFDNPFAFEVVQPDTQVVNFNDVTKSFDIERLFGMITEGMDINKKNRPVLQLSFEESPKFYLSTNYVFLKDSSSYRARQHVIELSQFFNEHRQPKHVFGHLFFREWDAAEWGLFDNFMAHCIQLYLRRGLVPFPVENYKTRQLLGKVPAELIEFMDDLPWGEDHSGALGHIEANECRFEVNSFNEQFKDAYKPDFTHVKRRQVTMWVQAYCKHNRILINPHKPSGRDKSGKFEYWLFRQGEGFEMPEHAEPARDGSSTAPSPF